MEMKVYRIISLINNLPKSRADKKSNINNTDWYIFYLILCR